MITHYAQLEIALKLLLRSFLLTQFLFSPGLIKITSKKCYFICLGENPETIGEFYFLGIVLKKVDVRNF